MPINFNNKELTTDSSFEDISQYAIEHYYWKNYPGKEDVKSKGGINRFNHGGVHVSCVTLSIELFIELYQHYAPDLLKNSQGAPLTAQEIKLLKLAAIYHESHHWNNIKASVNNFRTDLLKIGFREEEITEVILALENMEGGINKAKTSYEEISSHVKKKNIFQKLLQSACSLNTIKLKHNAFEKKYLDVLYDLSDFPGFEQELHSIIENHKNFMQNFKRVDKKPTTIHLACEHAQNCYLAVRDCFYSRKENHQLTLRELYAGKITPQTSPPPALLPLEKFEKGVFVRVLTNTTLAEERKIVEDDNLTGLQKAGLKTETELTEYLTKQERAGKKVLTPDVIWRPASFIPKSGRLPIPLYAQENKKDKKGFMLIIDAFDEDTFVGGYYKKSFCSNLAKNGQVNYTRSTFTRTKNVGSLKALEEKLIEIEARRQGIADDRHLKYFGNTTIDYSEVLLTHYKKILGIGILANDKASIQCAVEARNEVDPKMNLYFYTPGKGFRIVSDEEIQNGVLKEPEVLVTEPKDDDALDKILDIQNISNISIVPGSALKLQFTFEHQIYLGYVKNGIPVIEVNGETIKNSNQFLKQIYKKYIELQLQEINQVIINDRSTALQNAGLNSIKFSVTSNNKKPPQEKLLISLALVFDTNKMNHEGAENYLRLILGPYADKIAIKKTALDTLSAQFPLKEMSTFNHTILESIQKVAYQDFEHHTLTPILEIKKKEEPIKSPKNERKFPLPKPIQTQSIFPHSSTFAPQPPVNPQLPAFDAWTSGCAGIPTKQSHINLYEAKDNARLFAIPDPKRRRDEMMKRSLDCLNEKEEDIFERRK